MIDLKDPKTNKDEAKLELAASFMTNLPGEVYETNWNCDGQHIDLVAYDAREDKQQLVFAQVIFFESDDYEMDDLISEDGMRFRLEKAARKYLELHPELWDMSMRFDSIDMLAIASDCVFIRHHMLSVERREIENESEETMEGCEA